MIVIWIIIGLRDYFGSLIYSGLYHKNEAAVLGISRYMEMEQGGLVK